MALRGRSSGDDAETAVRFETRVVGERVEGIAAGIDRRHLLRLRAGKIEIEREVDLHGLDGRAARTEVRRALADAWAGGERCVLVVHGRGRRSPGRPLLKDSLPDWLAEPPAGRRVMAFASAQPRDGGVGATYVLLRRNR